MESSLVNGKIPISYLYLKQFILSHTAICTYTPKFLQHAVRVWFCLNNSSTLVWPHSSAAWCHTFFKRHQNKWSNWECPRKIRCRTEPLQARSKSSISAISSTVPCWESSASRTSDKDLPLLLSCPTENDNVQPGTMLHQNTNQRAK